MKTASKGVVSKNGLMGSMSIDFDFKPSPIIMAGKVERFRMGIRSFHEPLKRAVKEVVIPSIGKNFDAEGRPVAWAPLAEATLNTREAKGWSGGGILLLSGTLRKVAMQQNIWTITQQSATVRDLPQRAWYGKVHQLGYGSGGSAPEPARKAIKGRGGIVKFVGGRDSEGSRGISYIPARPFILIQDQDKSKIEHIFYEWLKERADQHWGSDVRGVNVL